MKWKDLIFDWFGTICVFIGVGLTLCVQQCNRMREQPTEPQVETVTYIDTIPYYIPVARDSVVVRYATDRLPVAGVSPGVSPDIHVATKADSVEVVIPITQKEYCDSTYHAWVSGYDVKLDSIKTFNVHTVTTVTPPPIKPKRWHIGVTAGYGFTPKGAQPYIGVGLSYSLYSF